MATLSKYIPASEAELHLIIQKELDALESGLHLLQHEYQSGKDVIDFLCVDSGGKLVIIEVKLHEDENVLFQALRYFSDIDKDRYVVASLFSSKEKVDPEESPRIILIAERFSEDIRRLSTLVVPEVELYEYSAVTLPSSDKGIIYHSVSLPSVIRQPPAPQTVEKMIDYLKEDTIKPILHNVRHQIKTIGKGIEEYATQFYIGYKHSSGRQFAYIKVYRTFFEFGAHIIDEKKRLLDYESIRIKQVDEDYSEILQKSKTSFINLGGKSEEPAT